MLKLAQHSNTSLECPEDEVMSENHKPIIDVAVTNTIGANILNLLFVKCEKDFRQTKRIFTNKQDQECPGFESDWLPRGMSFTRGNEKAAVWSHMPMREDQQNAWQASFWFQHSK